MNLDKEAVGRLWDEITPKLYGYLINTLKNQTLADDILQTTWLKAIEALPQFQDRGHGFQAWIFSIAKNEMRMHWRKGGREIPYNPAVHDMEASEVAADNSLVENLMSRLPEEDRELLRLRYVADLSFSEISKLLGMNPITARVRMHRILNNARSIIRTQITNI